MISFFFVPFQVDDLDFWLSTSDTTTPSPTKAAISPTQDISAAATETEQPTATVASNGIVLSSEEEETRTKEEVLMGLLYIFWLALSPFPIPFFFVIVVNQASKTNHHIQKSKLKMIVFYHHSQKAKKKKEKKQKKEKKEKKEKRKHRHKIGYEEAEGITTPSKEHLPLSQQDTPSTVQLPVSTGEL